MTAARSTPPHPGSDRQPARPRVALWRGVARASESVDRLARRVSRVLLLVSLCALAVIVSMTCADVLGAKLFRHPMAGFTSAVGIVHLIAIACAMGATFHEGRHIKVEIFLHGAPARLRAAIGAVTDTAGFLLFAIVIWRLLVLGQSFRLSGETLETISVPLYPFAYACAAAFVPIPLALLGRLLGQLGRAMRPPSRTAPLGS